MLRIITSLSRSFHHNANPEKITVPVSNFDICMKNLLKLESTMTDFHKTMIFRLDNISNNLDRIDSQLNTMSKSIDIMSKSIDTMSKNLDIMSKNITGLNLSLDRLDLRNFSMLQFKIFGATIIGTSGAVIFAVGLNEVLQKIV